MAVAFPVLCGRPPMSWDELRGLLPEDCGQVLVLGRACLNGLDAPPADFPPTLIIRPEQCFHLVAGQKLVNETIAGGAYLMTPAWLADWRGKLAEMGFLADQAGELFQDTAKELVLLDTGIDPGAQSHLAELKSTVKLPARRIAVGLDHTRPLLAQLVLEWRLAHEKQASTERNRQHAGELADHVAAMDMLQRLAKTHDEVGAIALIEDLFRMLFAPAAVYYMRLQNDVATPHAPIPDGIREAMDTMRNQTVDYAWTPDGQGFLLRIEHGSELLGLAAVDRVAFPGYRESYLNLARAVTGVCGLAIENARNRNKLLEAEKMASIGLLAAGVAHEINNPVGFVQSNFGSLERYFEQIMALLESYQEGEGLLDNLAESNESIGAWQERLKRLKEDVEIDYLKQDIPALMTETKDGILRIRKIVADLKDFSRIDSDQQWEWADLRTGLDSTLNLLSSEIKYRADVVRQYGEVPQIKCLASQLNQVFMNLLVNAAQAIPVGKRGTITVRCGTEACGVWVAIGDTGAGIPESNLKRIFDPFFTTKPVGKGTGLGLSVVYGTVKKHQGRIDVASEEGKGSTFTVWLPIEKEEKNASIDTW